jgi:tritrans,polycis-undecaprenyl-diphosphate synthase [geranylgeranyl-diphosphate specific]
MSEKKKYPKHIGLILDGNRRWAKERGKAPWDGHMAGFKKVQQIKDWMINLNIKETTLYCFSIQNFDRSKKEVFFLMRIFEKAFSDLLKDKDIEKYQVRIHHIGIKTMLPKKLQNLIKKCEEKTKNYKNYIINFALAYGGQEEIVAAVKKIFADKEVDIKSLTTKDFQKYLWLSSCPDIIIRTSGEVRTSNFLVWQQAYAEWFFLEKYWPDFSQDDLKNIIDDYLSGRERRFGK